MGSMCENADSGRVKAPIKFSQTCSLLSQYLKENKTSFRDLNLNTNGGVGTTKTMDLFPQQSGSVFKEQLLNKPVSSVNKSEPEASQMTIFYNGQVIVFNDFPADKAKELMLLASKSSGLSNTITEPVQVQVQVQKPIEPTSSVISSNLRTNAVQDRAHGLAKPVNTDVPIMRKASLTRFLEKRKDRIIARAPYAKPAETKSWLGLAAQGPAQLERQ